MTLVSGPVNIQAPHGVRVLPVTTTQDLYDVMCAECEKNDLIIQAAAPADFTPLVYSESKIKKGKSDEVTITFKKTPDVARAIGALKKEGQLIVGFAAETDSVEENALKKLDSKNLDMIVANNVLQSGAGFGVDTNIITLYTHTSKEAFPLMSKKEAADVILTCALSLKK